MCAANHACTPAGLAQVAGYTAPEGRITRCTATSVSPACATPRVFVSCPVAFQLVHYNDVHNRIEAATSSAAACSAANEVREWAPSRLRPHARTACSRHACCEALCRKPGACKVHASSCPRQEGRMVR